MVKRIILLTICICSLLFTSQEVPQISPYGGLKWEDDFFQVIEKLNKITDVTSFISQMGLVLDKYDLSDIKTRDDLQKLFVKAYMKGKEKNSKFPNKVYKVQHVPAYDEKGNEVKVLRYDSIRLFLEPVVILGVPFKMEVSLNGAKGLAAKYPDKMIPVDMDVFAHMILDKVELSSDSPLLSDKITEINTLLSKHYKVYFDKEVKENKRFTSLNEWKDNKISYTCRDGSGSELLILLSERQCRLVYKSTAFEKELDHAYKEALKKNEASKVKGKDNSDLFGK